MDPTAQGPVRLLAGDIGGTNARLVSYEVARDVDFGDASQLHEHRIILQKNYKNEDFLSFSAVLIEFLAEPANKGPLFVACCFAVAGPVVNDQINFTNRDGWIIDRKSIMDDFQIRAVKLVNDFVASGYGLLALSEAELITLQKGKPRADAPIALVGAGTGLGECFLSPAGGPGETPRAHASEGGHVEFAPRSVIEEELLRYLQDTLGAEIGGDKSRVVSNGHAPPASLPLADSVKLVRERVSVERVVSGQGLENIYQFLRHRHPDMVDPRLDAEYDRSQERGRLIGKHHYNYPLFRAALEIMFGIYGSEAGNVALKYLPYAGLYIAGGIAPKNVEFLNSPDSLFMERFREKGRMTSIMADIPVHLVMKEDLGLRGAHIVASRLVWEMQNSPSPPRQSRSAPVIERPAAQPSVKRWPDDFRNMVSDYPVAYTTALFGTMAATAAMFTFGGAILRTKR